MALRKRSRGREAHSLKESRRAGGWVGVVRDTQGAYLQKPAWGEVEAGRQGRLWNRQEAKLKALTLFTYLDSGTGKPGTSGP